MSKVVCAICSKKDAAAAYLDVAGTLITEASASFEDALPSELLTQVKSLEIIAVQAKVLSLEPAVTKRCNIAIGSHTPAGTVAISLF
jgi:hypothetical protein